MIELKKANTDPESTDSELIWQWRNDPTTRLMSRRTQRFSWKEHKEWYAQTIKNSNKHILLAFISSCIHKFYTSVRDKI